MDFRPIYKAAKEAGLAAGNASVPVPMIVGSAKSLFGDEMDPAKPQYYIEGGVCGFARIAFAGNIAFGRWAKKMGYARAGYPKGLYISVGEFGQSLQRKEAYAGAFAKVLRENGIEAWMESRMD